MATLRTKLTTSGNSRAVRLPKVLLELSQLNDIVELEAKDGQIIIRNVASLRDGWEDMIKCDLVANGPISATDYYGSFAAEAEATLGDGLEKW